VGSISYIMCANIYVPLSTRFHIDGSIGLCGTIIRLENRGNMHKATVLSYLLQKYYINENCIFFKQNYFPSFCGLKVSGTSVAPCSQVLTFAMLLLLM
jgi:hypothetical protein